MVVLRVPVRQAVPGMTLAAPLPNPKRRGTVLLREGYVLESATIVKLEEMGVVHIWVKYPGLADLARFIDPKIDAAVHDLAKRLEHATDAIVQNRHARLDYDAFTTAVAGLLAALTDNPAAAFLLGELGPGTYEARHAANVCMTSLLLGLRLTPYVIRERKRLSPVKARDVTDLGVGAMLADIGMLTLPREARDRFAASGDETDPEFREHVTKGFDVVKDWVNPTVASIVLNHHQRYDGSGFPAHSTLAGVLPPPKGSEIHIFHRIVMAADLLDRLRYPPGGDAEHFVPTVRALKTLISHPCSNWIDPIIRIALVHCVPAFAPGTLVTLSDGGMAAVVDWLPTDPCSPTVQRIASLDPKKASEGERIDLRTTPKLTVAKVGGADVRGDLFHPWPDNEFSLNRVLKALENRADEFAA